MQQVVPEAGLAVHPASAEALAADTGSISTILDFFTELEVPRPDRAQRCAPSTRRKVRARFADTADAVPGRANHAIDLRSRGAILTVITVTVIDEPMKSATS